MADVEPPAPKPELTPPPGADLLPPQVQRLASRAVHWSFIDWVAGLILLALVAAGAAYLVTPGIFGPKVPVDGGVGEIARFTVKADRDYDLPDDGTTAAQRDEAAAAVRPVYDYDTSVAQGALSRVRAGFSRMQEAVSAARARISANPDPAAEKGKHAAARKKDEPALPPEIARALEDEREDLFRELQVALDEDDVRALEAVEFSGEVEQGVEVLVRRFQQPMIATAADELVALGRRGITVRTFPSPGPRQSEVVLLGTGQVLQPGERAPEAGPRLVAEVKDLDHVRAELDQAEALLPEGLPAATRRAAIRLAKRLLRPNLTFNAAETSHRQEMARSAVKPVVVQLKRGDKVIAAGERIDKRHALIFDGMRAQNAEQDPRQSRLGNGLVIALLIGGLYAFGKKGLRRFKPTRKDVLLLSCWLLAMLALIDATLVVSESLRDRFPGVSSDVLAFAIPFAAGAMLIRFVLGAEEALLFSGVLALLAGMVAGNSLPIGLYAWVGALVAAQRVAGAKDRAALFRAGLWAGTANALMAFCLPLVAGKMNAREAIEGAIAGFVGGAIFTPVVVMSVAPLVEWLGGYVTDMKLLELANLNHPALKELIVQAPGTYHHSIIMGSLVESAAEAIGANPLLARVCAYYHDIGKGKNPLYFGENQKGENRHDQLAPGMSAQIIRKHVTDGIEMARQYQLPKAVADAIPQHHGTKLVGFFWHKAVKEAEAKGDPMPDEASFRYPGPKPQYPEAALVMIADAVEAASRALAEPSDANLQSLVKKMINGIFADGQLDECDLTLRDLNVLARAFFTTLSGIYHTRPQYPPGAMNPPRRDEPPQLRAVGDGPSNVKKLGT